MLTQQENLYYQVNSGRPITFVNKLAATFRNLGFLLEILIIVAHVYKRINSTGLKHQDGVTSFDTGILGVTLKCNIGNSEGRFWRFGGDSKFKELFFLYLFLDNAYLRVYLFGSLPEI